LSTGLIALLDDVASIAKVAAASLDDVAAQSAHAGVKAAGVVIDDAAVTPRYVVGFTAERELPIVRKIALGSVRNKLLYLLPLALLLSAFAPWAISPLLMLGGCFLCFEGAEKVFEAFVGHKTDTGAPVRPAPAANARELEDRKVSRAIKTDLILSAEIVAMTLSSVPDASLWMQGAVLTIVGLGITLVVYGGVALIVKADDVGVALATSKSPVSGLLGRRGSVAVPSQADRLLQPIATAIGRALVRGMPVCLGILGGLGTAAMLWVGGGIVVHGLEQYGVAAIGHVLDGIAHEAEQTAPALRGPISWAIRAAGSGIVGLVLGGFLVLVLERIGARLWHRFRAAKRNLNLAK
jgi:predicted DNA repair protein MutK